MSRKERGNVSVRTHSEQRDVQHGFAAEDPHELGRVDDSGTPAGVSQRRSARPKLDSGSDAGTARSSAQKKWTLLHETGRCASVGKDCVATDPPGSAMEKNPRRAMAWAVATLTSSARRATTAFTFAIET